MTAGRGRPRVREVVILVGAIGAGVGLLWLALQLLIAWRFRSGRRF